jgi:hypothetical protein
MHRQLTLIFATLALGLHSRRSRSSVDCRLPRKSGPSSFETRLTAKVHYQATVGATARRSACHCALETLTKSTPMRRRPADPAMVVSVRLFEQLRQGPVIILVHKFLKCVSRFILVRFADRAD